MSLAPEGYRIRDLSLAVRLVIALFLISVGIGYCSALVQLHFQVASPGKLLPEPEDAVSTYYGRSGLSQLERLLTADEGKAFNGSGSMRSALTTRSLGWQKNIQKLAKQKNLDLKKAEEELRKEREGERLALVDWIHSGASKTAYEQNSYALSGKLADHPLTPSFAGTSQDGTKIARIHSIFEQRCERCHGESASSPASGAPLENYEEIHDYCQVETVGGGMSLKKLAQTTHVHLLGFAMLYGLTGLIFAFTSYPARLRLLLAPLPLFAQLVDISCWWFGRVDPTFAKVVVVTGGIVGAALVAQIALSLFDLFDRRGRQVLLLLVLAAGVAAYITKSRVIDPYITTERQESVTE